MSALSDKVLKLLKGAEIRLKTHPCLVGLDGFVDQILRVVDKRQANGTAIYLDRIPQLAAKFQAAAGMSTKFELSVQQLKLGGNGPIMANALASFGLPLTCIGNLGYPALHPVFHPMKAICNMVTVAEPSYTDALEFDDGKIMLSRQEASGLVTWKTMEQMVGKDRLFQFFDRAMFTALDNWTALPHMSDIWRKLQRKVCPRFSQKFGTARRKIFFDIADPEFRMAEDIRQALALISGFQRWYDTSLGLNQKEAGEICEILKLSVHGNNRQMLRQSAEAIRSRLGIHHVVVHATAFATAASKETSALVEGPFIQKPLISTGAGDHFNAGYSLGLILEGDLEECLQLGVATSGFYVRTAKSPSLRDLRGFLKKIGER